MVEWRVVELDVKMVVSKDLTKVDETVDKMADKKVGLTAQYTP